MSNLFPLYGSRYQVDKIIRNSPSWWDTSPRSGDKAGSNFYSLLSAIGESDWAIGGYEPLVYVASGEDGVGTEGFLTVSGSPWEENAFRGFYLEDSNAVRYVRKARYEILSNTANVLTLAPDPVSGFGVVPVSGRYRILRPCSAMSEVRHDIQIRTAEYLDLDVKGQNVGVPRLQPGMTDALHRKLVPALSWGPKLYRPAIEDVLAIFLGVKGENWDLFELYNKNFVVEIYGSTFPLPDGYSSYLYASASTVAPVADPVPSYGTTDVTVDAPSPVHGIVAAGTFVLSDGTVVDEDFIQRVLASYCRAVGISVTLDFLGA